MTTLTHLLVFGAAAPVSRLLFRERARHWLMLVGSVLAVYWLQPLSSIRYLDFWLPTATLALVGWVWAATRAQPDDGRQTPPAHRGSLISRDPGSSRRPPVGQSLRDPEQGSSPGSPYRARAKGPLWAGIGEIVGPAALGSRGQADERPSSPTKDEGRTTKAVPLGRPGGATAEISNARGDLWTAAVVVGLVLVVGLLRYLGPVCCLTPARPPALVNVLAGVALALGVGALLWRVPAGRRLWALGLVVILALLVVVKFEPLTRAASAGLRALGGQPADLASALDVRWLGFSYVAFRLMHVLRDRASGRLPKVSLREFITYALFFPAYTAGPIDRVERFVKDYRQSFTLTAPEALAGGERVALGVFKKFVLADSLALVALNATNAAQTTSTLWLWVLLYAYAWRLYLDFSGYTDIALGLGRFFGIKLPENFDRPYARQNLTIFWNSWHITLSQWFRAYVFNPLTRALRRRPLPPAAIIFIGQLTIMLFIGLWHGVTWNFVAWGLWHAAGLFVHNRWADTMKPRAAALDGRPRLKRAAHWLGVFLTFHFVALGWVWFALPSLGLSLGVFARLLGAGG